MNAREILISLTWLLYNDSAFIYDVAVRFRPIETEEVSSMYNNTNYRFLLNWKTTAVSCMTYFLCGTNLNPPISILCVKIQNLDTSCS